MTTCDDCGTEIKIGDFPFCPHGRLEGGMLGEFHEYTDRYSFDGAVHITSLAQRNRLEREHGLTARSKNDPQRSVQDNARRELARQQARPELARARQEAIAQALQQHRR
jgi:hypothetical protein